MCVPCCFPSSGKGSGSWLAGPVLTREMTCILVWAQRGAVSPAPRGGQLLGRHRTSGRPLPGSPARQLPAVCPHSRHPADPSAPCRLIPAGSRDRTFRPAPRRAASTPSATCFPARSLSVCTWAPDSHSRSLNRHFRNTSMHTHEGYANKEMRSLFSRSALSGRGTENCHPAPRLVGGPARRWPPRGGRLPLPASPVTSLH